MVVKGIKRYRHTAASEQKTGENINRLSVVRVISNHAVVQFPLSFSSRTIIMAYFTRLSRKELRKLVSFEEVYYSNLYIQKPCQRFMDGDLVLSQVNEKQIVKAPKELMQLNFI